MRALQTFFGLATGGDVLHHSHEVAHGAALIGDGGDVVAQPQARAVGQHVPDLDGEALAGLDRLSQQIAQVGRILRDGEILDPHLQQLRRRTPNDLAEPIVDQVEASGRVDLGDAHDRLAEHGAQNLLLLAQLAFEASSRRHIGAHGKARRPKRRS